MKKQFFNYILLALLFSTCFKNNAAAQAIQAQARLQDYTIKIGEQTKLFLVVRQPVKQHINFPKLADTITGKLQIVSANKTDTVVDQSDRNMINVTQSYLITSFDAGTYKIPSFSFGSETAVVKSNEISLEVQTVKIDTTKGIYDIKQPLTVKYTFVDWLKDHWLWVLAGFVVLAAAVGLTWYLLKRPKKEPVSEVVKPAVPIHAIAINKLKELRAKKLWQQNEVKLYHIELTDIMREYLEKRYNVKTQEKTTDEILTALKSREIPGEYRLMLQNLLVLADLVKFAKEKPDALRNEESMDNAIEFILKTQQQIIAPPVINTTEGGGDNEPV